MKTFKLETLSEKQLEALGADLSVGNELIVETAGFEPLEVKIKRLEQNGIVAALNKSDFTSSDLREMWLNPDFEITPEDDIEDVYEKLNGLREYQEEIKKKVYERNSKVGSSERTANSASGSAAADTKESQAAEPVEEVKQEA